MCVHVHERAGAGDTTL